MSLNIFQNVRVGTNTYLGSSTDMVMNATTDVITVNANKAAGGVNMYAGTGGITIDASYGGSSKGTSNGAFNIYSKAASTIETTAANLDVKTATSGDLNLTGVDNANLVASGGDVTIDATSGAVKLGLANATSVEIGKTLLETNIKGDLIVDENAEFIGNVNVRGNFNVEGSTTSVGATATTSNVLNINYQPSATGSVDVGFLACRDMADVVANDTPNSTDLASEDVHTGTGSYDEIGLVSAQTLVKVGSIIRIDDGGVFDGQYGRVTAINSDVATINRAGEVDLSGTGTVASGVITGSSTAFDTELNIGDTVEITDSDGNVYSSTVAYIASATSLTLADTGISASAGSTLKKTNTVWAPVTLTGTSFTVSGTDLTGSGTAYDTQLSVGDSIELTSGTTVTTYVIASVTGATNAVIKASGGGDVAGATVGRIIAPGVSTYEVFNNTHIGAIFDESQGKLVLGFSPTRDGSTFTMTEASVAFANLSASNLDLSGTSDVDGFGSWGSAGTAANGALILNGGLGINSNAYFVDDSNASSKNVLTLEQTSSSSASAPLKMMQNYIGGNMMDLSGASVTSGSLTTVGGTIVNNAANTNITAATIAGYIAINVTDNNTGTHNLADGTYFMPLYTLT